MRLDPDMDEGKRNIGEQCQDDQAQYRARQTGRHQGADEGEDDGNAIRPALEQAQRAGDQPSPVLAGQCGAERGRGGEGREQGYRAGG